MNNENCLANILKVINVLQNSTTVFRKHQQKPFSIDLMPINTYLVHQGFL